MSPYILIAVALLLPVSSIKFYSDQDLLKLREEVREMFNHAYGSYLKYAYPYDELRPLSCDGIDTWGSYSLTLIDALDTLAIMGNFSEFRRVVDVVLKNAHFIENNINVSVFETNIRIIGGLLSAHLFSYKAGIAVEKGWPCNGPLLELAESVARKLIAAFDTKTRMPFGTVNFQKGVPSNETTVTCTAGVGTFILEFSTLSHLTGDPIYEELAMNAFYALWNHRSNIGLVGNHIDIQTGRWTAQDAGIGAGVDSYFEYLAKGAIFLQKPELMHMFIEYRKKIDKYLRAEDWYVWASMTKGQISLLVFQSLEAYWPGVLSLVGDAASGLKSIHNYHQVWKQYGFTPEFYNIPQGEASTQRESYPLRPELIESVMYLYRATGDHYLLEVGEDILRSIQHSSYTPCGYATIKDVRDHKKDDRMESFFLAETTKYLYLLFDENNFIHNVGSSGTVFATPWGECILDGGGYAFNTEAHPFDVGALHCCSQHLQEEIQEGILEFDTLMPKGEKLEEHRRRKTEEKIKLEAERKAAQSNANDGQKEKDTNNNNTVSVVTLQTSKDHESNAKLKGVKFNNNTEAEENGPKGVSGPDDYIITGKNTTSSSTQIKPAANLENAWPSQMDKINFSYLLEIFFKEEKTRPLEPQIILEKVRNEPKYYKNSTWETQYNLLRCQAQPFLARATVNGQFYDTIK